MTTILFLSVAINMILGINFFKAQKQSKRDNRLYKDTMRTRIVSELLSSNWVYFMKKHYHTVSDSKKIFLGYLFYVNGTANDARMTMLLSPDKKTISICYKGDKDFELTSAESAFFEYLLNRKEDNRKVTLGFTCLDCSNPTNNEILSSIIQTNAKPTPKEYIM